MSDFEIESDDDDDSPSFSNHTMKGINYSVKEPVLRKSGNSKSFFGGSSGGRNNSDHDGDDDYNFDFDQRGSTNVRSSTQSHGLKQFESNKVANVTAKSFDASSVSALEKAQNMLKKYEKPSSKLDISSPKHSNKFSLSKPAESFDEDDISLDSNDSHRGLSASRNISRKGSFDDTKMLCGSPLLGSFNKDEDESVGGLRSFGRLDSVDQMNIHQKLYDFGNGDEDDVSMDSDGGGERYAERSVPKIIPKSKAPPPVVVVADNTSAASYTKSSSSSNLNYETRNLVGTRSKALGSSLESVVSSERSLERSVEDSGIVLEVSNSSQVYLEEDFEDSGENEKIEKWEDEEDYTQNDDDDDNDDKYEDEEEEEGEEEREGVVERSDESSYEEPQKPKIASFSDLMAITGWAENENDVAVENNDVTPKTQNDALSYKDKKGKEEEEEEEEENYEDSYNEDSQDEEEQEEVEKKVVIEVEKKVVKEANLSGATSAQAVKGKAAESTARTARTARTDNKSIGIADLSTSAPSSERAHTQVQSRHIVPSPLSDTPSTSVASSLHGPYLNTYERISTEKDNRIVREPLASPQNASSFTPFSALSHAIAPLPVPVHVPTPFPKPIHVPTLRVDTAYSAPSPIPMSQTPPLHPISPTPIYEVAPVPIPVPFTGPFTMQRRDSGDTQTTNSVTSLPTMRVVESGHCMQPDSSQLSPRSHAAAQAQMHAHVTASQTMPQPQYTLSPRLHSQPHSNPHGNPLCPTSGIALPPSSSSSQHPAATLGPQGQDQGQGQLRVSAHEQYPPPYQQQQQHPQHLNYSSSYPLPDHPSTHPPSHPMQNPSPYQYPYQPPAPTLSPYGPSYPPPNPYPHYPYNHPYAPTSPYGQIPYPNPYMMSQSFSAEAFHLQQQQQQQQSMSSHPLLSSVSAHRIGGGYGPEVGPVFGLGSFSAARSLSVSPALIGRQGMGFNAVNNRSSSSYVGEGNMHSAEGSNPAMQDLIESLKEAKKDAMWAKARLSEMISLLNDTREERDRDRERDRERGEGQGRSRGITPLASPSKRQPPSRSYGGSRGTHVQDRARGAFQGQSAGGSSYESDSVYEEKEGNRNTEGNGNGDDETVADEVDDERRSDDDGSNVENGDADDDAKEGQLEEEEQEDREEGGEEGEDEYSLDFEDAPSRAEGITSEKSRVPPIMKESKREVRANNVRYKQGSHDSQDSNSYSSQSKNALPPKGPESSSVRRGEDDVRTHRSEDGPPPTSSATSSSASAVDRKDNNRASSSSSNSNSTNANNTAAAVGNHNNINGEDSAHSAQSRSNVLRGQQDYDEHIMRERNKDMANPQYPSSSGLFDLTSPLLTSQALFRQQLNNLRERMNLNTHTHAPHPHHTPYTPYPHPSSSTSASTAGTGRPHTHSPCPSLQQVKKQFEQNRGAVSLKLWEVIRHVDSSLDEAEAKRLAERYNVIQ